MTFENTFILHHIAVWLKRETPCNRAATNRIIGNLNPYRVMDMTYRCKKHLANEACLLTCPVMVDIGEFLCGM